MRLQGIGFEEDTYNILTSNLVVGEKYSYKYLCQLFNLPVRQGISRRIFLDKIKCYVDIQVLPHEKKYTVLDIYDREGFKGEEKAVLTKSSKFVDSSTLLFVNYLHEQLEQQNDNVILFYNDIGAVSEIKSQEFQNRSKLLRNSNFLTLPMKEEYITKLAEQCNYSDQLCCERDLKELFDLLEDCTSHRTLSLLRSMDKLDLYEKATTYVYYYKGQKYELDKEHQNKYIELASALAKQKGLPDYVFSASYKYSGFKIESSELFHRAVPKLYTPQGEVVTRKVRIYAAKKYILKKQTIENIWKTYNLSDPQVIQKHKKNVCRYVKEVFCKNCEQKYKKDCPLIGSSTMTISMKFLDLSRLVLEECWID